MKSEEKLNKSEDRGKIHKIQDFPLKNQADGEPTNRKCNPGIKNPSLQNIKSTLYV